MFGMPKSEVDQGILEMALAGYEAEREKIVEQIGTIRALLDGRDTKRATVEEAAPVRKRRKMSAAAKKRIGLATKRRWAALRKAKKKSSQVPF